VPFELPEFETPDTKEVDINEKNLSDPIQHITHPLVLSNLCVLPHERDDKFNKILAPHKHCSFPVGDHYIIDLKEARHW
jgi:hypothetical protein